MKAIVGQEKEKMKLGSLFDGIAGFPYSAHKFGITSVWASEIEPFPIRVSKAHFPEMVHLGDITQINGAEIEPVDVATGGSPCQDLSVAGKREGMNNKCLICGNEWFFAPAPQYKNAVPICPKCGGAEVKCTRSGLYMHQIRIIKEARNADKARGRTGKLIRPRFMVWENVPGALSSNNGEDFRAVLEEAARVAEPDVSIPRPPWGWTNAGCIVGNGWSIAWRILDAQHWGVPQRRRRIFLVADFAGHSALKILFERAGMRGYFAPCTETGQGIAANAERSVGAAGFNGWKSSTGSIQYDQEVSPAIEANMLPNVCGRTRVSSAVAYGICSDASNSMMSENPHSGVYVANTARTLDANGGNPSCNQGGICIVNPIAIDCRNHCAQKISGTLQAKPNGGQSLNYINPIAISYSIETYHCESHEERASTLKARDWKDPQCINCGYAVRRLTPLECDRLQGYPDGWTDIPGASDSTRYKADGNSVAIPCVDYVMEGIAIELSACDNVA